jgi:branched-subunit amino acid aminotransferase/4-amino-4-deoxychorismate lyase
MPLGATALHYGQSVFEGLRAFAQRDGSVRATHVCVEEEGGGRKG